MNRLVETVKGIEVGVGGMRYITNANDFCQGTQFLTCLATIFTG